MIEAQILSFDSYLFWRSCLKVATFHHDGHIIIHRLNISGINLIQISIRVHVQLRVPISHIKFLSDIIRIGFTYSISHNTDELVSYRDQRVHVRIDDSHQPA